MNGRGRSKLALVLALAASGCNSVSVTPLASAPAPVSVSATPGPSAPTPTDAWLVADVKQPSAVTDAPSLEPGYQCHPCHYLAENDLLGAGLSPGGPIAVGIQKPPAQAIAFSSTDGSHWLPLSGFVGAEGTSAIAVASNGATTVIVGLDHSGATAWASTGTAWRQAPLQDDLRVPYAAGGMTSVTPFETGFVGGGYRDDPLHLTSSAAVWRSGDGLTWHRDDGARTFDGGRIWGVAASAGTVVAVGTSGDPNYGPAAFWRWTERKGWQRGRIGPDGTGAARAVAVTPTGFVAVGLNGHDNGARTWTSPDGLTWTAAPDQPGFDYFQLPLRMQSIAVGPKGLVAAGWRSDAGKGSAVTWKSRDGVTWQGPTWQTSFSGGQMTGLVVSGGAVFAVGRTGYPDWNQATIWVNGAP